jgi:hypothetical protein
MSGCDRRQRDSPLIRAVAVVAVAPRPALAVHYTEPGPVVEGAGRLVMACRRMGRMRSTTEPVMTSTPTSADIADSMRLAGMGADLPRLRAACLHAADHYEGVARERLLVTAESMRWASEILASMGGPETAVGRVEGDDL